MYIKNSDMLYTEAVQLASFVTDGYSSDKSVGAYTARGYDIVYDFTSGKVKLPQLPLTRLIRKSTKRLLQGSRKAIQRARNRPPSRLRIKLLFQSLHPKSL